MASEGEDLLEENDDGAVGVEEEDEDEDEEGEEEEEEEDEEEGAGCAIGALGIRKGRSSGGADANISVVTARWSSQSPLVSEAISCSNAGGHTAAVDAKEEAEEGEDEDDAAACCCCCCRLVGGNKGMRPLVKNSYMALPASSSASHATTILRIGTLCSRASTAAHTYMISDEGTTTSIGVPQGSAAGTVSPSSFATSGGGGGGGVFEDAEDCAFRPVIAANPLWYSRAAEAER